MISMLEIKVLLTSLSLQFGFGALAASSLRKR